MTRRFDRASAQFVCDFVEHLPTTDTGQPFRLLDWQREALMEFYGTLVRDETPGDAGTPPLGCGGDTPSPAPGYGGDTQSAPPPVSDSDTETGRSGYGEDTEGGWLRLYWYLYLEIPKKNGKSELAAALGLYHLFGDGELNAEVYICAADKDNASIVYNAAVFMVQSMPWTAKMVARGELKITESRRRIEYRRSVRTGNGGYKWVRVGVMQVLSSEAFSKHGYKPSCVIFDELHAQPNRALWDVMTGAAGAAHAQPVWIVLTTAGDDPDRASIGWEIHQRAVRIRDARLLRRVLAEGGDARTVLSLRHTAEEDMAAACEALLRCDEENWLPILYGLTAIYGDDPDDLADVDIYDEALWYRCNPSLGKNLRLRNIRMEAAAARRSEADEKLFRWLRLNQWIAVKSVGWLPLTLYDKCQWGPSRRAEREAFFRQLEGKLCYGGVDLSTSRDLTAFVLLFPPQEGLETAVLVPYGIWRPEATVDEYERSDPGAHYRDWARAGFLTLCPGEVIDFNAVEDSIREARERYRLRMVGFDPYLSRTITQRIAPIVQTVEIPQDVRNLSPAMKEMEYMMLQRTMLHIHNTCFRWTFGNVRNYADGNGNIKPLKNRSRGRIDPTVAAIIAVAVWLLARAGADYDKERLGEDWSL